MPTNPFTEALAKLNSRTIRASNLASDEWSQLPVALRERSFFSARTTNAHYLQGVKDRVQAMLDPKTVTRDGRPVTEGLDLATARLQLKGILESIGYNPDPKDAGTIKDLSSDNRLNLLLTHNVKTAQGYGWHKQGQDPDLLDQWPAQELYRAEDRNEPRNWELRWNNARGQLGESTTALDGRIRMVALKNDPIWTAISAFETPYPPFDFNSGMDVRDVSRKESESLGIITPDQKVDPDTSDLNDDLAASTAGIDPEFISRLKREFGSDIRISGDEIKWVKPAAKPVPTPAPEQKSSPASKPVGDSVQVPPTVPKKVAAEVHAVVRAIDNVHGDGTLKPIPITSGLRGTAQGAYHTGGIRDHPQPPAEPPDQQQFNLRGADHPPSEPYCRPRETILQAYCKADPIHPPGRSTRTKPLSLSHFRLGPVSNLQNWPRLNVTH